MIRLSTTGQDNGKTQTIPVLIALVIITATVVVYLQTASFDVAFSEEKNAIAAFHHGFTFPNVIKALEGASGQTSLWVPVSLVFCMIDGELFGKAPGPRHLVNLFFHVASALILFIILLQSSGQAWPSGFVALLFAVHPLNVESVAWIAYHDTPLSAFFLMLGIWAYLGYVRKPSVKRYLLMTLWLILGMMSKPTIIFFPFILLLLDYWPLQRLSFQPHLFRFFRQRPLAEKIPLFFFIALWLAVSWIFFGRTNFSKGFAPEIDLSSLWALINIPVSYLVCLYKIFYPVNLVASGVLPPHHFTVLEKVASIILFIGLTGLVFLFSRQKHRFLVMGWVWFIIGLAPGAVMNAMKSSLFADRYAYLSAIGIFIIIVWGAETVATRWPHKKTILGIIGAAVLMILVGLSREQTRHWQNTISHLNHAIDIAPENHYTYWLLGDALHEANNNNKALTAYRRALQLAPEAATLYNSIGLIEAELGLTGQALRSYKKALEFRPEYAIAYHNLGNLLLDIGNVDDAISCLETALKIDPALFQTHNSLATGLLNKGLLDQATHHLMEALRINPHYETARNNLKAIARLREQNPIK